MRRLTGFDCAGAWCAATFDTGEAKTGLLMVSGGNEIRSGAHAGQAAIAAHIASQGYPIFRYDRRGVGESEGVNTGFASSAEDIAAAVAAFRRSAPHVTHIVAFGNCDAASALALFHSGLAIDQLLLANPWTIEASPEEGAPTTPGAAAIRARYWQRLKNPKSIIDLVTGKIDFRKLAGGLRRAVEKEVPTSLATQVAAALAESTLPATILLARQDSTARAFRAAWDSPAFDPVRQRTGIVVAEIDSASHSFADTASKNWLLGQILAALRQF